MNPDEPDYRVPTRYLWLAVLVCLAALLASCGGGGASVAGVGSGGTGASFSGPITGFGSIIVNGVRIDDSRAQITMDDDRTGAGRHELKLGMVVNVEGERSADGVTGTASTIAVRSILQGPVSAIDTRQNRLTVMGATVIVTSRTVFDGAGATGLAALRVNDVVEIHGTPDQSGRIKATRIERSATGGEVLLTGTVQAGPGASSFRLNDYTVHYQPGDLVDLANGVTAGMRVRVKGTLAGSDVQATRVRLIRPAPPAKNRQHAEVEGVITRLVTNEQFEVNDMPVRVAAGAKVQGTVAVGRQVEVEGLVENDVLVADRLQVEDDEQKGERDDAFEVNGEIASVNVAAATFTMRKGTVTVTWDSGTRFGKGGANAAVVAGNEVKVKGKMRGNVLVATSVEED